MTSHPSGHPSEHLSGNASGDPTGEVSTEEVTVSGEQIVERVKALIREGNVRRIIVKTERGDTLLEIPVTLGVVGALIAPQLAALGAVGALIAKLTVTVERELEPRDPAQRPHTQGAHQVGAPRGGTVYNEPNDTTDRSSDRTRDAARDDAQDYARGPTKSERSSQGFDWSGTLTRLWETLSARELALQRPDDRTLFSLPMSWVILIGLFALVTQLWVPLIIAVGVLLVMKFKFVVRSASFTPPPSTPAPSAPPKDGPPDQSQR